MNIIATLNQIEQKLAYNAKVQSIADALLNLEKLDDKELVYQLSHEFGLRGQKAQDLVEEYDDGMPKHKVMKLVDKYARRGATNPLITQLDKTAKKVTANKKYKEFVEYFRNFYGAYGLYPIKKLIDEDIIKGIKARKKNFDGDSIDRETIRDMILKKDFSLKWNPN